ncbi:hypothetical protein E9M_02518 [Moraxella catarrhalis 46P47B1]|uniref:Uncharacterized protein n=1 Tax=Moraxella catarrhalis TaxID=480 RepID=A0A3Q9GET0_MORCA|nr:hypothetical protein MCR_0508 [Moraxella catarrhalis BBH18]AZQ87610.1 hypothetical protein EJK52_0540 [Moraxella catarrhalis]EGE11349.1 hypothetical protein E9G_03984 [Moraxella catarrhalis 7169]EGE14027.1 hypothetical protein E9M_02518 [Moraxella catarrhalis 46P47B1]EGE14225.1 hypothetical protein E9O_07958 [Moraxella catarrhalis 12P80B1]EGE16929.1 hypothetical protein E9K_00698 [Moraxella catarrhalis 103P14B1]EGE17482.1 hypothetical protein E9Q_05658 [Moraxella catarrhalis BC1]EGE19936.
MIVTDMADGATDNSLSCQILFWSLVDQLAQSLINALK